jgi:hypothetical protein
MTEDCENGNANAGSFELFMPLQRHTEEPRVPLSAMDQPMTKAAVATRPAPMFRHFWFAAAAAALVALAVTAPGKARAAMPFDGHWKVQIHTLSGSCDRSYNFAASIVDGRLDAANGALLGTVNNKGGVSAMVGGGDRRASATGKLTGNSGGGRWTGTSAGAPCSGNWTAQRG